MFKFLSPCYFSRITRRVPITLLVFMVLILSSYSAQALNPKVLNSFQSEDFSKTDGSRAKKSAIICSDRNPLANAYFGDTHVHTAYSSDAYIQQTRVYPDAAYRYSFTPRASIDISQADKALYLERPLDFMAVTDHAEFIGEQALCTAANSGLDEEPLCKVFQENQSRSRYLLKFIGSPISWRDDGVCGKDSQKCLKAATSIWHKTIAAAERWNDQSNACEYATLIGYEYTSHRLGSNLHRNILFRNATVLNRPVSYIDTTREWDLWEILDKQCLQSGSGCDALSIPHNSNISNGRMFAVDYPATLNKTQRRQRASLRARLEPIVEIMQHKGDSECRTTMHGINGAPDEYCAFEKFEDMAFKTRLDEGKAEPCYQGIFADLVPHLGPDCLSPMSYVRYALIEGLNQWRELGVNPHQFGIIAASDTHNGIGGAVEEKDYTGHVGDLDNTTQTLIGNTLEATQINAGPGGLTGVWAMQNSREELFDAMRRREVFGTSGPRIQPRFFGSWDYAKDLCEDSQWLKQAYASGIPMGSTLAQNKDNKAPSFLAQALPDIGTTNHRGNPLEQLQIIKGWVDADGKKYQKVYVVANETDKNPIDVNTCSRKNPDTATNLQALCAVWQDPDFNADQAAVYYLRALEVSDCRYSHYQCQQLPKEQRPKNCGLEEDIIPKLIQERAWSSPIWYKP